MSSLTGTSRQRLKAPAVALALAAALVPVARGGGVAPSASFPTGAGASDPVIAAAGDIACDPADASFNDGLGTARACRQKAVSDLLLSSEPAAVLTLGDSQYEDSASAKYRRSFDPSWGRVKALIRPAVGNHEYRSAGAAGYFRYFGAAAGNPKGAYYSFDLGAWHLIALNSSCEQVGGCGAGSAQERWLRADLASSAALCVLAYWHHPRFSSGAHGGSRAVDGLWRALHGAGAEIVLSSHDHDYERFAPLDPDGDVDTERGIRQFVVGTGGRSHRGFVRVRPGSEVRNSDTFGVLELVLRPEGYEWRFLPEPGKTFTDSGSGLCH